MTFALRFVALPLLAGSLAAQQVFQDARKAHLPPGSGVSHSVVTGDFDRDGDQDAIVCEPHASGLNRASKLLRNDGHGRFADATNNALPARFTALHGVAADFDLDGDLDVATSNRRGGKSHLLLGDGKGRFRIAASSLPALDGEFLVAVDIDGDRRVDLVTSKPRVLRNLGQGRFADETATRVPSGVPVGSRMAAGDLDGDRDQDLVLVFASKTADLLFVNDGKGVFRSLTGRFGTKAGPSTALRVVDVDRDGDDDVAIARSRIVELFLNDGKGQFPRTSRVYGRANVRAIATGELNGDRLPDFVLGLDHPVLRGVDLLLSTGQLSWRNAPTLPATTSGFATPVIVDGDGDGDADVVLGTAADGDWSSGCCSFGFRDHLFFNDGRGHFRNATAESVPASAAGFARAAVVRVTDLNGDRIQDLVLARDTTTGRVVELFLGGLDGSFRDATSLLNGRVTGTPVLGDADGDGDEDLFVATASQNRLLLNQGTAGFVDVTSTHLPRATDWTFSGLFADLDGDRDVDLVVANGTRFSGPASRVLLNDGRGRFRDSGVLLGGCENEPVAGDLDGDGDLDVVTSTQGFVAPAGHVTLWRNDGRARFGRIAGVPRVEGATSMVLADVDRDRDLDLIVGASFSFGIDDPHPNRLLLNDGRARFTVQTRGWPETRSPGWSATRGTAVGDVDGDGDLDVVFSQSHKRSGQTLYYLGDGKGGFVDRSAAVAAPDADDTRGLVLADVDADGDLDLVLANADRVRLYANLSRHVAAPHLLRLGRPSNLTFSGPNGHVVLPLLSGALRRTPLPPFGELRVDLTSALVLAPFVLGASRTASLELKVPQSAALNGLRLTWQALIVDPKSAAASRLTNAGGGVVTAH